MRIERKKCQFTRAFDRPGKCPLMPAAYARSPTADNSAAVSREPAQKSGIFIIRAPFFFAKRTAPRPPKYPFPRPMSFLFFFLISHKNSLERNIFHVHIFIGFHCRFFFFSFSRLGRWGYFFTSATLSTFSFFFGFDFFG